MRPPERQDHFDPREVLTRQHKVTPLQAITQMRDRPRPGDRDHMVSLRQQPCVGQPRSTYTHLGRQRAKARCSPYVGLIVRAHKPRIAAQEVKALHGLKTQGRIGQQRAPDRAKCNKRCAKFGTGLNQAQFRAARAQGILRLHCTDMCHFCRTAQAARRDFRVTKAKRLARLHNRRKALCHFFNRHVRITTMDIKQTHMIDTHALK